MVVEELHQDGLREEKIFAPGYGEFISRGTDDLEALALAVPTDALAEPLPAELATLSTGAATIFEAAETKDWDTVSATLETMNAAWETYRGGQVPNLLATQMEDALDALGTAVAAGEPAETRQAAIDIARASLDLRLRFESPVAIDRARFDLWTLQLAVDATAADAAAVTGDVASLEWVRDRIAPTLDPSTAEQLDARLLALRAAVDDGDLAAATEAAAQLPLVAIPARSAEEEFDDAVGSAEVEDDADDAEDEAASGEVDDDDAAEDDDDAEDDDSAEDDEASDA
jgi:hypothetical protein